MSTTLSNQNKQCATCDLWGGSRKANLPFSSIFITVKSNEEGLCMGGGFNNMQMVAIATCYNLKNGAFLNSKIIKK
jgi:hypothetical protein